MRWQGLDHGHAKVLRGAKRGNGTTEIGLAAPKSSRLLPRYLLIAVVVSVLPLVFFLRGTPQQLSPYYYVIVTALGVWALGEARRQEVARRLQRLPWPVWLKVGILGYGAVIAEEMLVGTLFALNEGFTLATWLERMGQFIAFNLLAFTGAIWGLGVSYMLFPGLRHWHFWQAGLWGIFAESTYLLYISNPVAGALITAPNVSVYAIILAPLMLSLPERAGTPRWWQMPAAWAIMLALTIGPVLLLNQLRADHPGAFPSCEYIACASQTP
jgi:hypothetical protein